MGSGSACMGRTGTSRSCPRRPAVTVAAEQPRVVQRQSASGSVAQRPSASHVEGGSHMASVAVGASRRGRAKRISAPDAAALGASGDWGEDGTGLAQPDAFDAALAARVDELEGVKIRACLTLRPRAVLEADPGRKHFHWFNWHYTGYDRTKGDAGLANYIPCNLGEIPDYYRRFIDPPEIGVLKTCPKDEEGFYGCCSYVKEKRL